MAGDFGGVPDTLDLDRLQAIAEAATPGPWSQGMVGDDLIPEVDYSAAFGFVKVSDSRSDDGAGGVADATFIATFDPPTVLALVAAARKVRSQEFIESCANTPLMRDVMAERDALRSKVAELADLVVDTLPIAMNFPTLRDALVAARAEGGTNDG